MIMTPLLLAAALQGVWSGDRMVATFTPTGAAVEQDCAQGSISGPVRLDRRHHFMAKGVYTVNKPGPQLESDEGAPPATYSGQVTGHTLRLSVHALGAPDHSYTLVKDAHVKLIRCY